MRSFILLIFNCLFLSAIFLSCDDDKNNRSELPGGGEEPEVPEQQDTIEIIPLLFKDDITKKEADYEAVKIGEYLWMNRNFSHHSENPIKRSQIEKVLREYRLDPEVFQVDSADFSKYYGEYYSVSYIDHLSFNGIIYEGKERKLIKSHDGYAWRLPYKADFRQLFAMCGDASEYAVRLTLACRPGENPAAVPISYWIGNDNTNRFGFNCMPTGARHHAKDTWGTCFFQNDCPTFYNERGDFYLMPMAVRWAAKDGTVTIHDFPDTRGGKLWHWQNIRFCRRLSDNELGYKLYIKVNNVSENEWMQLAESLAVAENDLLSKIENGIIDSKNVDIVKTSITDKAPSGYVELPKGYIRGFYIQYVLDEDLPIKTIQDILNRAAVLK